MYWYDNVDHTTELNPSNSTSLFYNLPATAHGYDILSTNLFNNTVTISVRIEMFDGATFVTSATNNTTFFIAGLA